MYAGLIIFAVVFVVALAVGILLLVRSNRAEVRRNAKMK